MKESDRLWNQQKVQNRIDNANHAVGRVNGGFLERGNPRSQDITMLPDIAHIIRRKMNRPTRSNK